MCQTLSPISLPYTTIRMVWLNRYIQTHSFPNKQRGPLPNAKVPINAPLSGNHLEIAGVMTKSEYISNTGLFPYSTCFGAKQR